MDQLNIISGDDDNHNIQEMLARFGLARPDNQIDLNCPENLTDLEDPDLEAHREQARKQKEVYEAELNNLPKMEKLNEIDTSNRLNLSQMSILLRECNLNIQNAADLISRDTLSFQKIAKSIINATDTLGKETIYVSQLKDILTCVEEKLIKSRETADISIECVKNIEVLFNKTRRNYELVIDGLTKYIDKK